MDGDVAREDFTTTVDERVLGDLVDLTYRQFPQAVTGSVLGLLVFLVGLWGSLPPTPLNIWLGIFIVFLVLRIGSYAAYTRQFPIRPDQVGFWRTLFLVSMGLFGGLWAVPGIVFFPHLSFPEQVYLLVVIVAVSAGGAVSYGSLKGCPELIFIPALTPLIIRFHYSGEEEGSMISVVVLLFALLMIFFSKNLHRNFRRTMELNRRNEELLAALRVSEEKFRGLVENATDSIVLVKDDHIVYANQAAETLSGYGQAELLELPITEFMVDSQKSRGRIYSAYQQRSAGGESPNQYESQVKRRNGDILDVLVSSSLVNFDDGPGVIAMIKDITEIKKIERVKLELISLVSHEIRTPVTTIQSSLDVLEPSAVKVFAREEYEIYDIARKQADHLAKLVNDIKDLDRLESARMGYHMDRCSLSDLVRQAVESNRLFADSHGIGLDYQLDEDPLEVLCDFNRITQVLYNLITNAVKFSAPQGTVTIAAGRTTGWARVSVSNNGREIPPDFRDKIFLPFSQVDPDRDSRGTGLGLSICKTVVEDHHGVIGFESEPGQPTTFFFLLPEYQERASQPGVQEPI